MKMLNKRTLFSHLLRKGIILLFSTIASAVILTSLGGCNTLQSIEVKKEPTRTVYGQGQELDRSGLIITAHYKNNSEDVMNSTLQISGYNKERPGKQTVTVTLKNQKTTFVVTVVPVRQLTITKGPTSTTLQGDDFVRAEITARVEYENDAVPGENINQALLTFSGYDKNKAGNQTIIANYFGKQASFTVNVVAFLGIAVTSPPDNNTYFLGEDIDLKGLVVMGKWQGVEKPVAITQGDLSSFDKNRAGRQEVFITYMGKTASFIVTYVGMQALSITRSPAKLNYENGEALNLDGLQVQGTRTGSTSIEMIDTSRIQISGFDRFKGGNQTVTVSFGGKSDTFRVTVTPNPFVGTWQGMYVPVADDPSKNIPITLIITEDTWSVSNSSEPSRSGFSGTYARDNNNGKTATLSIVKNSDPQRRNGPTNAELLSPAQLKLSGGNTAEFARGLVFIK